jgi:hypothetical protein
LVLLERDESGELVMIREVATVAIGRCWRCKKRVRVLPCDVLPHKTYSSDVIEHLVAEYAQGNRSLRQVAWEQLGERELAHTTLHGWTEGLGAHALGRPGGDGGGAPISHLVAIAESRAPGVAAAGRDEVHVNRVRVAGGDAAPRKAAIAGRAFPGLNPRTTPFELRCRREGKPRRMQIPGNARYGRERAWKREYGRRRYRG